MFVSHRVVNLGLGGSGGASGGSGVIGGSKGSGGAGLPAGERSYTRAIIIVSIAIPAAVAFLILVPAAKIDFGFNIHVLPLFHAILNSSTAILLIASLYFIKNGQVRAHKTVNLI